MPISLTNLDDRLPALLLLPLIFRLQRYKIIEFLHFFHQMFVISHFKPLDGITTIVAVLKSFEIDDKDNKFVAWTYGGRCGIVP